MIIAIDGPAGSGKSTVAKLVASRLGFRYLDTGAMYRALAVRAAALGIALDDSAALGTLAAREQIHFTHVLDEALPSGVAIGGHDVTEAIRTPQADAGVSAVAKIPEVRSAMLLQQRALAAHDVVVVEGRDIGTVVFPRAELKIFLTASAEERARRRSAQNAEKGLASDQRAIEQALRHRDEADSTRAVAPLVQADDAVALDTTGLSIDDVVSRIVALAGGARS